MARYWRRALAGLAMTTLPSTHSASVSSSAHPGTRQLIVAGFAGSAESRARRSRRRRAGACHIDSASDGSNTATTPAFPHIDRARRHPPVPGG
jgi:hypothetical protein